MTRIVPYLSVVLHTGEYINAIDLLDTTSLPHAIKSLLVWLYMARFSYKETYGKLMDNAISNFRCRDSVDSPLKITESSKAQLLYIAEEFKNNGRFMAAHVISMLVDCTDSRTLNKKLDAIDDALRYFRDNKNMKVFADDDVLDQALRGEAKASAKLRKEENKSDDKTCPDYCTVKMPDGTVKDISSVLAPLKLSPNFNACFEYLYCAGREDGATFQQDVHVALDLIKWTSPENKKSLHDFTYYTELYTLFKDNARFVLADLIINSLRRNTLSFDFSFFIDRLCVLLDVLGGEVTSTSLDKCVENEKKAIAFNKNKKVDIQSLARPDCSGIVGMPASYFVTTNVRTSEDAGGCATEKAISEKNKTIPSTNVDLNKCPDYYKVELPNGQSTDVIGVLEPLRLSPNIHACFEYLYRAGRKEGATFEQDVKKALSRVSREKLEYHKPLPDYAYYTHVRRLFVDNGRYCLADLINASLQQNSIGSFDLSFFIKRLGVLLEAYVGNKTNTSLDDGVVREKDAIAAFNKKKAINNNLTQSVGVPKTESKNQNLNIELPLSVPAAAVTVGVCIGPNCERILYIDQLTPYEIKKVYIDSSLIR